MNSSETASVRYWFPKPYADFVQRLRVVAGFALLATFAFFAQPTWQSMWLSLPVCILGLGLRAWAAGHLAKNQQLARSGPYAHIRNPLYAGTLVAAAGIVIASRSLVLATVFAAVFLLVYLPAVELEEQHLREIFPDYAAYANGVRRFVPTFSRGRAAGSKFSLALYRRNQEYKAAGGFLIALAWLLWKCWRTTG